MKYLACTIAVTFCWVAAYGDRPVEKHINQYSQGSSFAALVYRNKLGDIKVWELVNGKEASDLFHYLTDSVFKEGAPDTAIVFLYERSFQSASHQPIDATFTDSTVFYKISVRDSMYFSFDGLYAADEVAEVIFSMCDTVYTLNKRSDGNIMRNDADINPALK